MFFLFDFANYFKMIGLAWNEKVPKARYRYLAVLLIGVPITSIIFVFSGPTWIFLFIAAIKKGYNKKLRHLLRTHRASIGDSALDS